MAVSKVDRGPTDPSNILCLVVEKKNKFHNLGIKGLKDGMEEIA